MFVISEDAPYAQLGKRKISDLTVDEFRSVMIEILQSHADRRIDTSQFKDPRPHPWEAFTVAQKTDHES